VTNTEYIPDVGLKTAMETVERHKFAVIDLWAPWCYPCELMIEVLQRVISHGDFSEYRIMRVNADQSPEVYERFGVRALPALLGFHDGALVGKKTGYFKEEKVREFLSSLAESQ